MLSTVSPVIVGADAASPQPITPLSASMRTTTLSACRISTPAMTTGFFIGMLTAIGSMRLIFMACNLPIRSMRPRAPHRAGGIGELERDSQHPQGADRGMLDRLDHGARGGVRIVERLGDRVDLGAGNADRLELGEPGVGAIVRQRLLDQPVDDGAVLDPRAVAREALVLRPFRMAEHLRAAGELPLVADR